FLFVAVIAWMLVLYCATRRCILFCRSICFAIWDNQKSSDDVCSTQKSSYAFIPAELGLVGLSFHTAAWPDVCARARQRRSWCPLETQNSECWQGSVRGSVS